MPAASVDTTCVSHSNRILWVGSQELSTPLGDTARSQKNTARRCNLPWPRNRESASYLRRKCPVSPFTELSSLRYVSSYVRLCRLSSEVPMGNIVTKLN